MYNSVGSYIQTRIICISYHLFYILFQNELSLFQNELSYVIINVDDPLISLNLSPQLRTTCSINRLETSTCTRDTLRHTKMQII